MLILTAIFGKEVNSSRRWLSVGTMVVQPSEFMKMGMVIALAKFVQRTKGAEAYNMSNLIKPFLLILLPFALIIVQPDLGTALILLFIASSIVFFEGVRLRTFVMLIGIVGLTVPLAWQFELIEGYQKDRIVLWMMEEELDPTIEEEKRILDKNLQSEQAKWAIGRGRSTGTGLMSGVRSRLKYLPEIHNDFILAIYAEEQGFVGCVILLFLYFCVIAWGLAVAASAREKFGALVAVGVSAMIFWQVVVNVGMVTGMLPVVGSQLPVLSYGGSSLLTTFMGFGLLLNISVSRVKIV
jgi:rod shape determining protein RodA